MTTHNTSDDLWRGQELQKDGRYQLAEEAYRKTLAVQPAHPAAWHYFGVLCSQTDRPSTALVLLDRSIYLDPNDPRYYLNRALANERNGSKELARTDLLAASRLAPYLNEAYLSLADLSREMHRYEEASIYYSKALTLHPSCPKTWMNLGAAYDSEKRLLDALWCYQIASRSDPSWPDPELNAALCNLLLGNFERGWQQYESRWRVKTIMDATDMTRPLVTSRPFFSSLTSTGTVFVWAEQGLGDDIMFGSLVRELVRPDRYLIVQCDKRLKPLFERSMPGIRFIKRVETIAESEYNFHVPLGSLPRLLRPSLESFSNHDGAYLHADPQRTALLASKLRRHGRCRVGVSWGSIRGKERSVPLHQLLVGLASPDVDYVCLQYGDVAEHIDQAQRISGIRVHQDSSVDVTNDIDGLAALIETCDIVVTVGNATAHLAGALGKTAVVLLPFHPGWRWLATGERSPWYPTLKLLRQPSRGQWNPILKEAGDAVRRIATSKRST